MNLYRLFFHAEAQRRGEMQNLSTSRTFPLYRLTCSTNMLHKSEQGLPQIYADLADLMQVFALEIAFSIKSDFFRGREDWKTGSCGDLWYCAYFMK